MQYNQSTAMFANFFIHILASEEEGREKMAQPQQPNPPPKFIMIDSLGNGGGVSAGVQLQSDLVHDDEDDDLDQTVPIAFQKIKKNIY